MYPYMRQHEVVGDGQDNYPNIYRGYYNEIIDLDAFTTLVGFVRNMEGDAPAMNPRYNVVFNRSQDMLLQRFLRDAQTERIRRRVRSTMLEATRIRHKFDSFPMLKVEDIKELEGQLHKKEDLVKEFKKLIEKCSGFDAGSFLRAAVRKVFTDELADKYAWEGTREKPSAKRCFCISLIKDVCRAKYGSDGHNMNVVLQEHFNHARDRLNNRSRAKTKAMHYK